MKFPLIIFLLTTACSPTIVVEGRGSNVPFVQILPDKGEIPAGTGMAIPDVWMDDDVIPIFYDDRVSYSVADSVWRCASSSITEDLEDFCKYVKGDLRDTYIFTFSFDFDNPVRGSLSCKVQGLAATLDLENMSCGIPSKQEIQDQQEIWSQINEEMQCEPVICT